MAYIVDIGASYPDHSSVSRPYIVAGYAATLFECDESKWSVLQGWYAANPDVRIETTKVTPDNIVELMHKHNVPAEPDLLSIDIDGYDYFVLDALLGSFRPARIIAEINEHIPPPLFFTVKYKPDYWWNVSVFYGMSIVAADELAARHGYTIDHLDYNNLILRRGQGGLTPEAAWRSGYWNQPDRQVRFPHNLAYDAWEALPAAELVAKLNELFKDRSGEYILRERP